jgi:hypothetical protein
MNKKMLFSAIPVLLIAGIVLASPVINNSDFETPTVTAAQKWDIFDDGTTGLGWTVEWYDGSTSYGGQTRPNPAHLELHRGVNGWLPHSGDQYAELDTDWDGPSGGLNNEPASVKITQDLETTIGCEYTLTYWWSPRPNHADNSIDAYVDGTVKKSHSGSGSQNTNWQMGTVVFTATSSTTEIGFAETGTPDSLGMFLDDVSITEECPNMCEVLPGELTEADENVPGSNKGLGVNRWIFDGEEWITTQPNGRGWDKSFSIEDTRGCNCEQILTWLHENYPEEYGEMKGHWKFGCSISVLEDFIGLTMEQ